MKNKSPCLVWAQIGLLFLIFLACEKKPTTPLRDNLFDPQNQMYDNNPPEIVLKLNTLQGVTGETEFVFDATESHEENNEKIDFFAKWDLDGDGLFDEEFKQNNLIKKKVYETGGGKKALRLRLMGARGLQVDTSFTIFVNTRPRAIFVFSRDPVDYRLYHFDASASYDFEDGQNLQFRWDFEGDGVFDTDWMAQDTVDYYYSDWGQYQAQLVVRDNNNLTAESVKEISVEKPLLEMVYVEGGTFLMGDSWGDGFSDELPVHSVQIDGFYMSKYEITQAQYREVMGTNPSLFVGDNRPVESISWLDAVKFCNELSSREKLELCYTINPYYVGEVYCDFNSNGYRLPTEAEWEYAARGGNQTQWYKYSGSNNLDDVAWYYYNSGSQTAEVGLKQPNELGIYDMSGNVSEWCWDWYDLNYYGNTPLSNPTGPENGTNRVLRGGGFKDFVWYVRVVRRASNYPSSRANTIGFRVVKRP